MTILVFKVRFEKPKVIEKIVERVVIQKEFIPEPSSAPLKPIQKDSPPELKPTYHPFQTGNALETSTHYGADIEARFTGDEAQRILLIAYDLGSGKWVQVYQSMEADLSPFSKVEFSYKGEGSANTLELKIVDANGSGFGARWDQGTRKPSWTSVGIPLAQLKRLSGGDNVMDWKHVRQLVIIISRKKGDEGGPGAIQIKGLTIL